LAGNLRRESSSSPAAEAVVARLLGAPAGREEAKIAPRRPRRYSPYAVDWRFLPDEILWLKDFVRHYLATGSNTMARTEVLSPLWVETIGRNIAKAVTDAGMLFVHIPKTGGTSISKVLYHRNLPHYTARFWYGTFGRTVADFPSFSVIRHPVERLVSTYKMALAGGTDIVAYSRYCRWRLRGLESFEAFVDHLFDNRERLTDFSLDFHEQAGFVLDQGGRVIVDRLFALDARHGLPGELGRWLAIPAMPHLNATRPLPLDVSRTACRKIGQIYWRDFELYHHLVASGGVADMRGRQLGDES
jgi:hypothetical protein